MLCNYCGVPSHSRSECRLRIRDSENGVKRHNHPDRGLITSNNQARREAQAKNVETTDLWNTRAPTPPPQHQDQQITQGRGQNGASAPMIITRTQNQTVRPPDNITTQNGPRVASLLPSGMVACNECGDVYTTWAQTADHYNSAHTPGQQAQTYESGSQP